MAFPISTGLTCVSRESVKGALSVPPFVILGFVALALWLYATTAHASCIGAALGTGVSGNGFAINNPGNIRFIATNPWRGQIGNHKGYGVYDTLGNGVRALGQQLNAYVTRDGVSPTVQDIISKWAPSSENNTGAYIADVSQRLGVNSDTTLAYPDILPDLVAAIIWHENGYNSIDQADLLAYLNS